MLCTFCRPTERLGLERTCPRTLFISGDLTFDNCHCEHFILLPEAALSITTLCSEDKVVYFSKRRKTNWRRKPPISCSLQQFDHDLFIYLFISRRLFRPDNSHCLQHCPSVHSMCIFLRASVKYEREAEIRIWPGIMV